MKASQYFESLPAVRAAVAASTADASSLRKVDAFEPEDLLAKLRTDLGASFGAGCPRRVLKRSMALLAAKVTEAVEKMGEVGTKELAYDCLVEAAEERSVRSLDGLLDPGLLEAAWSGADAVPPR